MTTIAADQTHDKNRFHTVAAPFLQRNGLPFAEALSAEDIEQAFAERGALFGQEDIFSTEIVLWAFLAQVLREGKGAACAAAVADIATHRQQTGGRVPCGDTGDYCRARAKLDRSALAALVRRSAGQLEQQADPSWRWQGLVAKLVDGFAFTMMDTPANQRAFPQAPSQEPGVGFPLARACAVLSLVIGRARCTSKGRVKLCHLREVVCREVGSWVPTAGITKELTRGEPTQDGDCNFNTDIA